MLNGQGSKPSDKSDNLFRDFIDENPKSCKVRVGENTGMEASGDRGMVDTKCPDMRQL
jgi:hypothetical protein